MGTPYSAVYNVFLSKVTDSLFYKMDKEERNMALLFLMDQSIPLFRYPKVDLDDRNEDEEQFTEELSNAEIQIISEIMRLRWIEQLINDEELLKQEFHDQDYSKMSQAAHLFRLITLKREIELRVEKMQHSYTKVKDRKPDFSGLAGR